MKSSRFLILTLPSLIGLSLLISCTAPAPQEAKTPQGTLEEINKQLEKAVLEGNYEEQLTFFSDDVILDAPLEPPIRGKKALQAEFEKNRQRGVKYHAFSGKIEDSWTVGDKIYVRGSWGLTVSSNEAKQPLAAHGSSFEIWKKLSADSYVIEYLIYTLDHNPFVSDK